MPARTFLLSLVVLLAACAPATTGVTAPPAPPVPQASGPAVAAPPPVELAQAAGGCAADLARFRAVIENDRKTGHVAASVHENITRDLVPVEATCQAGRSAEASRALATVRTRYGYR